MRLVIDAKPLSLSVAIGTCTAPPSPCERKSTMTIKQTLIATALLSAIAFAGNSAAQDTTDYSALSNEQLIQLRSEVRNMSSEDQTRFRTEMQSRARNMTPDERTQAGFGPPDTNGNGAGQGQQTQKRDGTGNQDRTMDRKRDGTGNQDRANDRTRDGSRYGDGQGTRPRQGSGRGK